MACCGIQYRLQCTILSSKISQYSDYEVTQLLLINKWSDHGSLHPPESTIQIDISIGSDVFARLTIVTDC